MKPPPAAFSPRFFITVDRLTAARAEIGQEMPGEDRPGSTEIALSPADERHARQVLRARPGDPCEVVLGPAVGAPRLYVAEFVLAGEGDAPRAGRTAPAGAGEGNQRAGAAGRDTRRLAVRLLQRQSVTAGRVAIVLVQALPQPASADLIVEKGTEVGVDEFVFFPAAASPRLHVDRLRGRVERWRRIATEAAKQSKQLAVPSVDLAPSLPAAASLPGLARLLALEPSAPAFLREELEGLRPAVLLPAGGVEGEAPPPLRLALLVGPESGWTDDERTLLGRAGVRQVGLGRRVLRAETAGPVAAALVRLVLDDL